MPPIHGAPLTRRRLLYRIGIALTTMTGASQIAGRAQAGRVDATEISGPRWEEYYDQALGGRAMGYAYAVARDGRMVGGGGSGFARSAFEGRNPSQRWTIDTLCNVASVSKPITAVAIMSQVQQRGVALLDEPIWPLLVGSSRFSGTPGAGVDHVTIRHLLTQRSGLVRNGTLYPDTPTIDDFIAEYLRQDVVNTPGSTYRYSNTNFTILQVIYEIMAGGPPGSYARLVLDQELMPLGVDVARGAITATPRQEAEALDYSDAADTRPGKYWRPIPCVGAGGWLATAGGLLQFLIGLRTFSLLGPQATETMFADRLGWYSGTSGFGVYYHHNGGLFGGAAPRQELHTGIVHFPQGYDAVLLVNSGPAKPIRLMAAAFGGG